MIYLKGVMLDSEKIRYALLQKWNSGQAEDFFTFVSVFHENFFMIDL
jgi:hypothetical protein